LTSVAEYREQISAADRALLAAVNRRLELVRALHEHKRAEGIPLRDPAREEQLVVELQAANPGPLSSAAVAELFRHVLDLTRKELHGA
jgi:chorismate mutase